MNDELIPSIDLKGSGGRVLKIRFVPPTSLALRNEVTFAIVESEARASGAALGLCSPGVVGKHVPYRGQAVLPYGQSVLDWLLSEGVTWFDALNAGRAAWQHVSAGLIPDSEIAEREGFSVVEESTIS